MRLSTDSDDAGYRQYKAIPSNLVAVVSVDGCEITHCVTADSRVGYVLAYALGADGRAMINAGGDRFMRRQLHGRVEIKLRPRK